MKERDALKETLLKKYFRVFQDAWKDFLRNFEKGEYLPSNEVELRCFLFAKCLEIYPF
jgi:hypothetical protein